MIKKVEQTICQFYVCVYNARSNVEAVVPSMADLWCYSWPPFGRTCTVRKVFVFKRAGFRQEHCAPFLWSSCEPSATLYAHSLFDMSWNTTRLLKYFPQKKKKKKGAQCSAWEEPVASTSTALGFLGRSIYSIIDLGVVTSPSCSRQQWKICLGVHIHSRVNFSSRMSEGCRKITRGRQGREILVQTHEQRTYALTYALIRDALLYCQAGVAQADN